MTSASPLVRQSNDVSERRPARTKGARRCTNPECEIGTRWVIGKVRVLRNGKFSCLGKGCHSVYEARDVIDPANELYVRHAQMVNALLAAHTTPRRQRRRN